MRRLLALAAAVAVLPACGGDEEAAADLPLGKQIAATASVDPGVQLFAEPVRATVEVVVDTEHLDPARLQLETELLPYDVVERSDSVERHGRFAVLRYEHLIRCVRIDCIPEILASAAGEAESGRGERRNISLPPARVLYDDPDEGERLVARALWPGLVAVSRIRESDVPSFGYVFKTSVAPLPEPDYRVSPALLGGGLLVAAALLLALPASLLIGWARRRRPVPVEAETGPELTPLERALLLVEWAREREDGVERREALEVLATELDALERDSLARSARTLAWSPASPAPESADELVRHVREEVPAA